MFRFIHLREHKKSKSMKKLLIVILCVLSFGKSFSQTVNLSSFTIITDDKKVYLDWVLASGSTCNGMKVFRSLDTTNFVEVGDIAGVCGSSSGPVPYDFTDETPLINQTMYYKIRFGFSQFSETRVIFLKSNEGKNVLVKPNPVKGEVEIEFDNNAKVSFSFKLYNLNGILVYSRDDIKENSIKLDVSPFAAGQYNFVLSNFANSKYDGKIVITK